MPQVTSPSYVARIMKEKGIGAKKGLGQNFLVDRNIAQRILDHADRALDDLLAGGDDGARLLPLQHRLRDLGGVGE